MPVMFLNVDWKGTNKQKWSYTAQVHTPIFIKTINFFQMLMQVFFSGKPAWELRDTVITGSEKKEIITKRGNWIRKILFGLDRGFYFEIKNNLKPRDENGHLGNDTQD